MCKVVLAKYILHTCCLVVYSVGNEKTVIS